MQNTERREILSNVTNEELASFEGNPDDSVEAPTGAFRKVFTQEPAFAVRAPGRVNLIGEHTDYNSGLAMPCAISLATTIQVAPRADRRIRIASLAMNEDVTTSILEFEIDDVLERTKMGTWSDYVAGPIFALGQSHHQTAKLRGFDALVSSRVPIGAGLSSSAALGVAAALALARVNELDLSNRDLAELAWLGERDYVGTGCGILDFYASALGRQDAALLIDCLDQSVREIPFPPELEILIAHSGVERSVATSRYTERAAECARALEQARSAGLASPATRSLRSFDPSDLPSLERHLDAVAFRRARHVIEENERVVHFASAIAGNCFAEAGAILNEGMESLQAGYEASAPELDLLCEAGNRADGCHGSRLTGAGWGGCSIHLIEMGSGAEVSGRIRADFADRFGRVPPMWSVRPAGGARTWLSGVSDSGARRR